MSAQHASFYIPRLISCSIVGDAAGSNVGSQSSVALRSIAWVLSKEAAWAEPHSALLLEILLMNARTTMRQIDYCASLFAYSFEPLLSRPRVAAMRATLELPFSFMELRLRQHRRQVRRRGNVSCLFSAPDWLHM